MRNFNNFSKYSVLWIIFFAASCFFPLSSFAQTTFSDPIAITHSTRNVRCVFSADLDGDGDFDVLAASLSDSNVTWYENTDGLGTFGPQRVVTSEPDGAVFVYAADLDGDDDLDVIYASEEDNSVAWSENTDGLGSFGPQQLITTDAMEATSVFSIDIDGDGDNDVLSSSKDDDKIAWYENLDGLGNFSEQLVVATNRELARSVYSADMDGDGDNDILAASRGDNRIVWYENVEGGQQHLITNEAVEAWCVYSADIDGDGDNDVLSASYGDDKIAWYENEDGLGNFGEQQVITTDANQARCVFSIDLDGDGDLDVLSAFDNPWHDPGSIAWYENTDGLGDFGPQQIITTEADEAWSVFSADLDGDGDNDVLSASKDDGRVAWYENTDGLGDFGEIDLISPSADGVSCLFSNDIDGDGDKDILGSSMWDNRIFWLENIDGFGEFSQIKTISTNAVGATEVFSTDLDGDGDNDVVSASYEDNKIAWYENTDGMGTFGQQQIINDSFVDAASVFCIDLDGDDDNDIIAGSVFGSVVTWYENTDGLGNFGEEQTVGNSGGEVFCADLDSDGDNDVVAASFMDSDVIWYENTDGLGSFGELQYIQEGFGDWNSIFCSDLDNDNDIDVISANTYGNIRWFENIDGLGNFETRLGMGYIDNRSAFSIDLDNDGDNDVIGSGGFLIWYENLDGLGNFSEETNIGYGGNAISDDFDGDGDNDIVSNSSKISFFRNELDLPPLPPFSFSLLSPEDESVFTTLDAMLEWEEAFDRNYDFSSYWIYVSNNPDDLEDNFIDSTTSTSFNFTGEYDTQYWWSILARDEAGNETWAEQVFSFTMLDPGVPPLPFDLMQPDSGSILESQEVVLEWEEAVDPDDDMYRYHIYLADNKDSVYVNSVGGTISTGFTYTGSNGNQYWWTILARDEFDNETWANQVYSFTIDLTSVEDLNQQEFPTEYELTSIYPNPFNPSTTVTIGLPESSFLRLNVYNILGQHLVNLADNQFTAGYHNFTLDGSQLASGIYFVSATVEGKLSKIRKVVLMK